MCWQDCNFHECAKLDEFESMRQLSFTPPDGEFVLLNYRINAEFRCPFRLFPSIGDIDPYRSAFLFASCARGAAKSTPKAVCVLCV